MKISEVSISSGLSKKAIAYYEQKDLISPSVDESGYRIYSQEILRKLKKIKLFKDLGLSIDNIKKILDSSFPDEELRKSITKMKEERGLNDAKLELLSQLAAGTKFEDIQLQVDDLCMKASLKLKLLDAFPGMYGRMLYIHFGSFLEEPIKTKAQQTAYKTLVNFLDNIEMPEFPDGIPPEVVETFDFWSDAELKKV